MYLTKGAFRIYSEVHDYILKVTAQYKIKLDKRFEDTISTRGNSHTRLSTALLISEMKTKTTMRHCYIFNRMDIFLWRWSNYNSHIIFARFLCS